MRVNREGEASYAGLTTFGKAPLVLDPADLVGADVAIVGAPIDETVSYRPGARFGPRAIRAADPNGGVPQSFPNMHVGVDFVDVLSVVDFGDACLLRRSFTSVEGIQDLNDVPGENILNPVA